MRYEPNINDPRVLKRIKHAYGYAKAVFKESDSQCKSKLALNKHFGQAQHPLAKFLKHNLLICTDHFYSDVQDISKKYSLNAEGAERIRKLLQDNIKVVFPEMKYEMLKPLETDEERFDELVVNEFAERDFGDELRTLEFTYSDKSGRLWHNIQNIRREHKKRILADAGLKHNYDIQACAPTLLMQHAQQVGDGLWFNEIHHYLQTKTAYRQHIAEEVEIAERSAKLVVNALFCGARLGNNSRFALSKVLNNDPARIELTRQMTADIRADIKTMWSEIIPTMSRKRDNETGRLLAVQSRQKWARYFQLERQVLDSVRAYLTETGNKHFLEHDGWCTEKEVDQAELIAYVRDRTGFAIQLDYECIDISAASAARSPEVASSSALTSSLELLDATSSTSSTEISSYVMRCRSFPYVYNKSNLPIFRPARAAGRLCFRQMRMRRKWQNWRKPQ